MTTTYTFNIINTTNINNKIIQLEDRINVNFTILTSLVSVSYNGVNQNVLIEFSSALSTSQQKVLNILVQIIIEERTINEFYPSPRTITSTRFPNLKSDILNGYNVGDVLVNTTNDELYVCQDNTIDTAVWFLNINETSTQTLTNKTITDTSNACRATVFGTSGANVNIDPNAPLFGQSLIAGDAVSTTWNWEGWRTPVKYATTIAGNLATDFENGDTIDGNVLATNDRILIKNQVNGVENGIYIVNTSGAPTRAPDFPSGINVSQTYTFCQNGNTNSRKAFFVSNSPSNDVVGTDIITFLMLVGDSSLERLSNSTFYSVQHLQDIFHSAGYTSGGTISDAGGGNIDIASGTGLIRSTDSSVDIIKYFDWSASTGNAVPTNTSRYIGVEYNSGNPQVSVRSGNTWNYNTEFPLGEVYNDNGTIHILNSPWAVGDHASFMIQRIVATNPPYMKDEVAGGLTLSETGTRNLVVSSGILWNKLRSITVNTIDTSASDTFTSYYRNGIGGFISITSQIQWQNTQYDDGSGTLANLTASYYGVNWFYIDISSNTLRMIYGRGNHQFQSDAEAEGPPDTLPMLLNQFGVLFARLIFQNGASTATLIEDLLTKNTLTPTISNIHNNLSGLQGGTTGQYYHITSDQSTYLNGISSTVVGINDVQTLSNKTITSSTNNITANSLRTATTTVDVSSATAPSVGQALVATSSTTATWQIPSVLNISQQIASSILTFTTMSTSFIILTSMNITPGAGTYLVMFSSSGQVDSATTATYQIFNNSVAIADSLRRMIVGNSTKNVANAMNTQTIMTVLDGQSINIKVQTNSGTFTIYERNLILIKLS